MELSRSLPLTDFDDRFDAGARLLLEGDERRVEWSRSAGGDLVVKLRGIDNRTVAELYRGRYLEVGEDAGASRRRGPLLPPPAGRPRRS